MLRKLIATPVALVIASSALTLSIVDTAAASGCDSYTTQPSEGSGMFTTDDGSAPAPAKNCPTEPKEVKEPKPTPTPTPEPPKPQPPKQPEPPKPQPTPQPTPQSQPTPQGEPKVQYVPHSTPDNGPKRVRRAAKPPADIVSRGRTVCYGEVVLTNKGGMTGQPVVNGKSYVVAPGQTRVVRVQANKNGAWKAVVKTAAGKKVLNGTCGKPAICPVIEESNASPAMVAPDQSGFPWWALLAIAAGAFGLGTLARRRPAAVTAEDTSAGDTENS